MFFVQEQLGNLKPNAPPPARGRVHDGRPIQENRKNSLRFHRRVNDEMLLPHARERVLRDGDAVEVIPTICGGCEEVRSGLTP